MSRCRRLGGALCLRGCTTVCALAVAAIQGTQAAPIGTAPKYITDSSGAPILSDDIAILQFVEQDCGAEGFTFYQGKLHAVVWRDGVACTVKKYDIDVRPG